MLFSGSMTALVTPFNADGSTIDHGAMTALVERQIAGGTQGLIPVGTTGESATLGDENKGKVIATTVKAAAGRIPVIAGTGTNSTWETIEFSKEAEQLGADALIVVTPYYVKPTQAGIIGHFAAIHEATRLPIIVYNIPGRSVIDITRETMVELAKMERVVGVKDATNDLTRPLDTRLQIGPDFAQLSGEDATVAAFLAQGGHGWISVTSNVAPVEMRQLYDAWQARDMDRFIQLRDRLMPLHRAMFVENSPAPAKFALAELGHCNAVCRLPISPLTEAAQAVVREALAMVAITEPTAVVSAA